MAVAGLRTRSLLLVLLLCTAGSLRDARADVHSCYSRLSRTINLELANETEPWGALVRPEHLEACKLAGFSAVRLPVSWAKHTSGRGPAFTIDPGHFARVDAIVSRCLSLGLAVIVDNHKDRLLMADPSAHRDRFLSITRQLAEHYRGWSRDLMLEPMAEPHGALNRVWNRYFRDALAVIRGVDAHRVVLVGPPGYNAPEYLKYLELPPDGNLIVCVHIYDPAPLVFQGESFIPGKHYPAGVRWTGTRDERQAVAATFDVAAEWGRRTGRPVFVEEFGCTDRADLLSRVRWTAWCRQLAETRGLAWGVWGFGPSFSIYDLSRGTWRRPLIGALFPRR